MTKQSRLITHRQIMFSVFCFLQASPLFQSLLFSYTAQESWFAIILAALGGLLGLLPVLFLYRENRGCELCGILKNILGEKVGRCLAFIYLLYFFLRVCASVSRFSGFLSTNMLQRTPIIVITGLLVVSCITCASRGAENLCGMAFLFSAMLIGYVLLSAPLLANSIRMSNLLPVFTQNPGNYVKGIVTAIAEPFASSMIFLELFDENESRESVRSGETPKSKITSAVILGYLLSAGLIIFAVFRDNAVFGEFSDKITAISFQAARLISVGEVLSRLELIYAILFVTTVFFRTALTLYCLSKLLANAAGRGGSTRYVLPFGMLLWGVSMILFSSNSEMKRWSYISMPFYVWLFEIILPLVLATIYGIKSLSGKKDKQTSGIKVKLEHNKDGKSLYIGMMLMSGVLLTVIVFCFFVFNVQIPGPLKPAMYIAEKVLGLIKKFVK